MQKNISRIDLIDMMTFDRVEFEKNISLSAKKKVKIESKWELVRIGQIAQTQYGFTDKARDKGEIRYLRITDLNDDGSINTLNDAKFISPSEEVKNQFLLKNNDIVIARSGSVGKTAIYKSNKYEKMIFASYLIRLVTNSEKALPYYLFNFTKTNMYWNQVEANSIAVTQPNLNAEKIKDFKIPLPPKEIQKKIILEIEELEEKENEFKNKIKELKEKIEDIISNIKSNNTLKISEISKNLDNLRKPVTKGYRKNGKYPYYGASGVVDYVSDYLIDDTVLLISEDGANLKSRIYPIAFTANGKIWVNNHAHVLKFNNSATHKLVKLYINQTDISEFITGQAQPKLNQKNLNSIKIPLPSISEQNKLVHEIEKIEKEIEKLESEMKSIPQQKELILKKYL